MKALDLRGIVPAPITLFTRDGRIDHQAIKRLGSQLSSVKGTKGLVVLGHAGEDTFLTRQEQADVICSFVDSIEGRVPVIAGITGEGMEVAALRVQCAIDAGASAGLLYPPHGWLRSGYQKGAPQGRYRVVYEESGLPLILFQHPGITKAICNLEAMLDISAQPGVLAMKNGVRNTRRWDTEIPVIHRECPGLQILSCHDEYLLYTAFDIDGFPVGYGSITPELLLELLEAGKAQDYMKTKAVHGRLLPVIKAIYHCGSHIKGTVALKHALVERGILEHAAVYSPLLPLEPGVEKEIKAAIREAGIKKTVI